MKKYDIEQINESKKRNKGKDRKGKLSKEKKYE